MKSLKLAKDAVRRQMKQTLAALSKADKQRQSAVVTQLLLAHPTYERASRVALFLSMDDEINTSEILRHSLLAGKQCFIPRYDSKSRHMDMVQLASMTDYDSLPETSWGIKQPPLGEERKDALLTGGLDLVLVPGLAFTKQGHRLGRGRGYYDTFLAKCASAAAATPPALLALAFKEQLLDAVPTDDTDVRVDHVMTAELSKEEPAS